MLGAATEPTDLGYHFQCSSAIPFFSRTKWTCQSISPILNCIADIYALHSLPLVLLPTQANMSTPFATWVAACSTAHNYAWALSEVAVVLQLATML